jgi:succinate-semialdehyde dehydrogenase / glutarate-semialdehyde dehydrogenase
MKPANHRRTDTMTSFAVVNPATGDVVANYPTATDAEVQGILACADRTFVSWSRTAAAQRAELLARVAALYASRRTELAAIITREMGKPRAQAEIEIDIVVTIYDYYAQHGPQFIADETLSTAEDGVHAVVQKVGLGVLLGIMPWNFPYYQVARFAAPNLMNGNTIVLKPAPQCPESALAMASIFRDAGAPAGAYTNLFATPEQITGIIADPRVHGVSLTGSEQAGAAVAELAGRQLKKVVLELGGSDPFLVLDSANVDQAVEYAFLGRFRNAGQACNAAKRIIVAASVFDEFLAKFVSATAEIVPGDPRDLDTFLGPLASVAAAETLAAQVSDAIELGAKLLTGGSRIDGAGAYFEPTVLTGVTTEMRAYTEELFGPVAVIYRVESDDEAVQLANDSDYGLGAVVASDDLDRAHSVANQLATGMVYINQPPGTSAELPFGGIKRSGVGRELGRSGMEEFVNRKLIHVRS